MAKKKITIISVFEYSARTNDLELLDLLIEKHQNDPLKKDIVEVYKIEKISKNKDYERVIENCRLIYGKTNSEPLKVKVDLLEANAFYCLNDQKQVIRLAKNLDTRIEAMTEGYVKEAFKLGLYTMSARVSLYSQDEPGIAVEFANKAIECEVINDWQVATMHHLIGQANIMIDVEKSITHLTLAADMVRATGDKTYADNLIRKDIPFVYNINNIEVDLIDIDESELAHQHLVRGNHESVEIIINNKEEQDVFDLVYLAYSRGDVEKVLNCYSEMLISGNLFFATLIKQKLTSLLKGTIKI